MRWVFSEALDLTTASGRALAGMLAVFADFERDILRDRVKAGIAQARQKGRPHGRPAHPSPRRQHPQAPPRKGQQKRDRQAPEREPNLSPPAFGLLDHCSFSRSRRPSAEAACGI